MSAEIQGKDAQNYVFISYSHKQAELFEFIRTFLKVRHVNCWTDKEIPGSSSWGDLIAEKIENSHAVLAFLSKDYVASPDCEREFFYAASCKKTIIPVFLEDFNLKDVEGGKKFALYTISLQYSYARNEKEAQQFVEALIENNPLIRDCMPEPSASTSVNQLGDHFFAAAPHNDPTLNGPERPMYTAQDKLLAPIFNSRIDGPFWGDERSFVAIAEVDAYGKKAAEIEVPPEKFTRNLALHPGRIYEVRIGFHNNGDFASNTTGKVMARNARISSSFPPVLKYDALPIVGKLSSNNGNGTLWSMVQVSSYSGEEIYLHYLEGSAKFRTKGKANGTGLGSAFLLGNIGQLLGYNNLTGNLPAGEEFAGYISYRLYTSNTKAFLRQFVSKDGKSYDKPVEIKAGDTLHFKMEFKNAGYGDLTQVVFRSILPEGFELLPKTTVLTNNANPNGVLMKDVLAQNGFAAGCYGSGAFATINYQVRVTEAAKYAAMTQESQKVTCRAFCYYSWEIPDPPKMDEKGWDIDTRASHTAYGEVSSNTEVTLL